MAKRFIMTAFTRDRKGVVADITKIIFDNGCNLEDTEMTQLEDEFVLILLFSGEKEGLKEQLSNDCRRLEKEKGISAYLRELEGEVTKHRVTDTIHTIHAEGLDQAGIVYKISNFLAGKSINILRLNSRRMPSPESGTTMYKVDIEIEVPNEMPLDNLEQGLSDLGNEMHIDLNLDPAAPGTS